MGDVAAFVIMGVVLVLVGVTVLAVLHNTRNPGPNVIRRVDPSTGQIVEVPLAPVGPPLFQSLLAQIRETDPDFSFVLLEDFARGLFVRACEAGHDEAGLDTLSLYVVGPARDALLKRKPKRAPVRSAVPGTVRLLAVLRRHGSMAVGFEAYLAVGKPGEESTQWVRETWYLKRRPGCRTRRWKGNRTFGCPACGAASVDERRYCNSCGQVVRAGEFDWAVDDLRFDELGETPPRPPWTIAKAAAGPETVFSPDLEEQRNALLKDDPAFTFEGLDARLRLVFEELQKAWTTRDLSGVRPFVSAGICHYLEYWLEACSQQRLRHSVEKATIDRSTVVRVVRDSHYDSLTLRVWLRGRSWTERVDTGETVAGSWTEDSAWTEYWTLSRATKVRGAPRADRSCPTCGAGLEVGPEGNCASCGLAVTTGDLDWILGRIEQDGAYTG